MKSPTTIEKMRQAKLGKKLSTQHREAISIGKTGKQRKPFSTEHINNMKASQQIRRHKEISNKQCQETT